MKQKSYFFKEFFYVILLRQISLTPAFWEHKPPKDLLLPNIAFVAITLAL